MCFCSNWEKVTPQHKRLKSVYAIRYGNKKTYKTEEGFFIYRNIIILTTGVYRNSRLEMFCWKGNLSNFAKLTGKHLCQSLSSATLLKERLWYRCFPVNFAKFSVPPIFCRYKTYLLNICRICRDVQVSAIVNKVHIHYVEVQIYCPFWFPLLTKPFISKHMKPMNSFIITRLQKNLRKSSVNSLSGSRVPPDIQKHLLCWLF